MQRFGRLVVIVGAMALAAPHAVLAQDESMAPEGSAATTPAGSATTVVPPGGDPLGVPYGEWGARWWEWLAGIPAAGDSGLNDNCQANQGGEVFFIPHTWAGTSFVTNCEIGADQWVLASAGGTFWTNSEGGDRRGASRWRRG